MSALGTHPRGMGAGSASGPSSPSLSPLRLVRLHLVARRAPLAATAILGCAAVLRLALTHHWGARPQELPLVIEVAAAAIIATTIRSPFGEPERATGRWLPYLRLGATVALSAFSLGVFAAVSVGANLPGGVLELVRNLCGLIGIGALGAATLGGEHAWTGVFAYGVLAEYALTAAWTTPWIWPAQPPHDIVAALCAGLAFVAGVTTVTVRGARDPVATET